MLSPNVAGDPQILPADFMPVRPPNMIQKIVLLGDSDVSRWPSSLLPSIPSAAVFMHYAKSGACLVDLLQQIAKHDQWEIQSGDRTNSLFVCCAGENDIGSGRTMEQMLGTFGAVLDALFTANNPDQRLQSRMIFFGPKFEPWMTDDNSSRKKYVKLNNGFQRAIRKHRAFDRIIYVDCLTLFCTKETASEPGAVYGGRAIPDIQYFDSDGLHLNDAGYSVWKQIVAVKIAESERKKQ
jgi:lysophospholipase L1-like esterase